MSAALLLTLPFWACAKDVTIIYTNDLHAHVEPYKVPWIADSKRDIGGWANITTMVKQEKAKNNATWFFDAGDYFTGPYISSLTKGKAIIDIMNTMSYDAVTIGNHEFDFGLENMARLFKMADFPIVCANYGMEGTALEGLVKPYVILERDGLKIGVFGLGAKMEGLVQADKCEGVVFKDPVPVANEVAAKLKDMEGCDAVVCLSHLGIKEDEMLVHQTRNIDVVLGGHSHTFMQEPVFFQNLDGESIPVSHTGKNGIFVGKIDLTFERE